MKSLVYVAAPFQAKAEAARASALLESVGFIVTHKWWLVEHEDKRPVEERTAYLQEHAWLDYMGAHKTEILVMLHLAMSEGKAVEQGIAIEKGIPIVAVGERGYKTAMNIFHWLPNYTWVSSIEEAIELCQQL